MHDGWLDFGNLPEPLQQGVIERLADPASGRVPLVRIGGETRSARDWLAAAIANREPTATPDQLAPYSLEVYRQIPDRLYEKLAEKEAAPVRFFAPDRRS